MTLPLYISKRYSGDNSFLAHGTEPLCRHSRPTAEASSRVTRTRAQGWQSSASVTWAYSPPGAFSVSGAGDNE